MFRRKRYRTRFRSRRRRRIFIGARRGRAGRRLSIGWRM